MALSITNRHGPGQALVPTPLLSGRSPVHLASGPTRPSCPRSILSRSSKPKGPTESEGSSRSSGEPRTEEVQASAEVLELHPPSESVSPTAAVLHEFRAIAQLLERVERLLLSGARQQPTPGRPTPTITDETFIDQRSGLVPKDVYLRLARARAFPSNKIGKRILARWGDVRAAVLGGPGITKTLVAKADEERGEDGLDDVRRQLGFVEKGR